MIEMIGDFDTGQDPFGGEQQRHAALACWRAAGSVRSAGLEAIRFHNQMSSKTCPGTSIDRRRAAGRSRGAARAASAARPTPADASPFSSTDAERSLFQAMAFLRAPAAAGAARRERARSRDRDAGTRSRPNRTRQIEARCACRRASRSKQRPPHGRTSDGAHSGGQGIAAAVRRQPTRGKPSTGGEFTTSQADVDADLLDATSRRRSPSAAATAAADRRLRARRPVGERDGLGVA